MGYAECAIGYAIDLPSLRLSVTRVDQSNCLKLGLCNF